MVEKAKRRIESSAAVERKVSLISEKASLYSANYGFQKYKNLIEYLKY